MLAPLADMVELLPEQMAVGLVTTVKVGKVLTVIEITDVFVLTQPAVLLPITE